MIGDILSPTHLLFVLVVALLVLGPKRLPEAGRALGRGIRDFRTAISGDDDRSSEIAAAAPTPPPEAMVPPATAPPVENTPATAPPVENTPAATDTTDAPPHPAAQASDHPAEQPAETELFALCREHLAPHKTPVHWVFLDAFPLTGSGKIQKYVLREGFNRPT